MTGRQIERGIFVAISVAMIFLSIIAWISVPRPPPMVSLLFSILPFGFILTAVDSLAKLRRLSRLGIGIYTSLLALVFVHLAIGMFIGLMDGDGFIPIIIAVFFTYHNLRINRWWRLSSASDS